MTTDTPTVLVVDDERDLANLYGAWLADDYQIRTAYDGETAIEAIDEDVDVALIDRLMPGTSGDEVLAHVRRQEYDCQVSMVTAVEPDFDIIELGFDEYIVKPIRQDDLVDVVGSLVSRNEYDEQLQAYFSLVSKRAALQSQKTPTELENSDAYAELSRDIARLEDDLERTTDRLTDRDFEVQLRQMSVDGQV